MKTNFISSIFLLLFSVSLSGQVILNSSFNDLSTAPCPWDSSVMIQRPDFWLIYQTQDDRWDGPIDSTRCIGVYEDGFDVNIDLEEVDIAKPIFVRYEAEVAGPVLLNPDELYNTAFNLRVDDNVSLELSSDCENDLCSGLILGIEIPDSLGTGVNQRLYQASAESSSSTYYSPSFCYPTESLAFNNLNTYVLKITLDTLNTSGDWIQLRSVNNETGFLWDVPPITEINVSDFYFQDTSYVYNFDDLTSPFNYSNLLMKYTETTYPSPQNLSFVDINPVPNVPEQALIDLYIEEMHTLVFQPFTFLRGGLIEGSDTLRHEYNLINNGASICMYPFIELVFSGDNAFVHQGGSIDFHGQTSCMMFKDGGSLEVRKDAYLQYGDGGEGILAFGRASQVVLQEGSTLAIDNKVVLLNIVNSVEEQVHVDLQPGSALIFDENASLVQASGSQGNQVINVYMNGGFLDDRQLSQGERQMINRIYPEEKEDFYLTERISLYPNPVSSLLTCRFKSESAQPVTIEIVNMNGQVVCQGTQSVFEGMNDLAIPISLQQAGMFMLRVETREGILNGKFLFTP